jgi:hypothetical protein
LFDRSGLKAPRLSYPAYTACGMEASSNANYAGRLRQGLVCVTRGHLFELPTSFLVFWHEVAPYRGGVQKLVCLADELMNRIFEHLRHAWGFREGIGSPDFDSEMKQRGVGKSRLASLHR